MIDGASTPPGPRPAMDASPSALAAKLDAVHSSDTEAHLAAGRFGPVPGAERDYAVPAPSRRVRLGWRSRYTRWVVALDLLVSAAAAWLTGQVLGAVPVWALLVFPVVVVLAVTLGRSYEHRFMAQGGEEYRRLLISGVGLLAAVSTAALVTGAPELRSLALLAVPAAVAWCLVVHLLARRVLRELRSNGLCMQRCVAIGLERSVAELVRVTRRDPDAGLAIVAACVGRAHAESIESVPVLGTPAQVRETIALAAADTVVLTAWSDVSQDELRRLSWDLEGSGIALLVAPRITEVAVPRMHVLSVGGVPLLHVDEPEFTGLRRVAKAGLDYSLTIVGLLLISPVLAAVAIAVRLGSPGPVLFRQERIGRHGEPFTMHKFRSMYVDAEARLAEISHLNQHEQGPLFKLRDDPRITRVGGFIRRFSLDELPQLFDVLLGRMSLVGPRPPLSHEVDQYEHDVRRRLLVKPGITGLWQVSGRSDLSWEESVRLDLSYVENWSLGLDVSIIVRTVTAVVARDGAY